MMEQRAAHILVVDDELPIRTMLADLLRRRGFTVTAAATGEDALGIVEQYSFDLLLLDLRLPGLSGIDVARRVRGLQLDTAIIILTAYATLDSAVESMHLGVSDYIQKTTGPHEVVARVVSVIEQRQKERRRQQLVESLQALVSEFGDDRKTESQSDRTTADGWLAVGDLKISIWRQVVQCGDELLRLTPTEFRVLVCLAQHAGQVMTYQQIMRCAKGYEADVTEAAELIKPHIYHLRQKIEPNPDDPRSILTVRGTGYLLAAHPATEQPATIVEELIAMT